MEIKTEKIFILRLAEEEATKLMVICGDSKLKEAYNQDGFIDYLKDSLKEIFNNE